MKKRLVVGLMLLSSLAMADGIEMNADVSKLDAKLEATLEQDNFSWSSVRGTLREKVDLEADLEYKELMKGNMVDGSLDEGIAYSQYQQERLVVLDEWLKELTAQSPMKEDSIKNIVDMKADIRYDAQYSKIVEENPFDWSSVKLFHIF